MDKNTIAGLVIIFLILIGFSYLTRPSKEQVAEMQRKQDSIARVVILFSYKTIRKTKSSPWKMIK